MFGALCHTGRISHLCIRRVLTCSHRDEPALQSVKICWYVSHTWGNQCHLVTWIKTITPGWLCTQYSTNMHLRQLFWAHTHTTRSRALMTRDGRSRSYETTSSFLGLSAINKLHNMSLKELQCLVSTEKTVLEHNHNSWALRHVQNRCPVVSSSWLHPPHLLSCKTFLRIRLLFVGRMSRHALQAKCMILWGTESFQRCF